MEDRRRESTFIQSSGLGEASPAGGSAISRRRGGGLKRKATSSSASPASAPPSKRAHRDKANASLSLYQIHNGPLTRARQLSDSVATSSSLASAKDESLQAAQASVQEIEEVSEAQKAFQALEADVEAEVEAIRSRDDNAHVVPVPAGWFSWTNIHPIEKHFLPSFFNGKSESRSPEIYMEIRNWIVNKFHTNPSANIESNDLSELSVGELDARKEILEFLDCWGLINYHPFPPKDCDNTTAAVKTDDDTAENLETSSLIEKLYRFETEQSYSLPVPTANMSAPSPSAGLLHESAIAEELGKQEGPSVEYHCNSCSADCSRKRYHCQKQADFDLCSECYNDGKFGSDMSPSDFILMEFAEAPGASGGRWTDQETLLLLEALELFKENWNEIAEHVATKTKAQCILHFLQMPIEDNFLDSDDEIKDSAHENADSSTIISDTSEDPNSAKAETVTDKGVTNNDSPTLKDASETPENRNGSAEKQTAPSPSPMETLKAEDAPNAKMSMQVGNEFAVKALQEAFEAVGYLPSPEGKLSFSDAGNPVMLLAKFFSLLADPSVTSASVRASLKSIGIDSLHLRHCFLLEDPPDGEKESDPDTLKEENQKKEDTEEIKQTEENITTQAKQSTPVSDQPPPCEKKEKEAETSVDKSSTEKPDDNSADGLVRLKVSNESTTYGLSEDQAADATKESTSEIECERSKEASQDVIMESSSVDAVKKQESSAPEVSTDEDGAKTGDDKTNDAKSGLQNSVETKDDQNLVKLKRAAVATLAAAAVKAKLLADQEEDEIKQIAALLVEKQLRKLEVKLSFFAEMENATSRVKDLIERSRQLLYHERAQIIAARFGIPPSSTSRPLMSTLPAGKTAVGPTNRMMRPPLNPGASFRPPAMRPSMTPTVTSAASAGPTGAGGSFPQPGRQ